jgi:hypothetical protein
MTASVGERMVRARSSVDPLHALDVDVLAPEWRWPHERFRPTWRLLSDHGDVGSAILVTEVVTSGGRLGRTSRTQRDQME